MYAHTVTSMAVYLTNHQTTKMTTVGQDWKSNAAIIYACGWSNLFKMMLK